ncbi:MAG TPA: DUF4139 domain-containing protein, partial [Polyangiaceae bacterium]|nr:DUF4139 domain-containing protein [Polyangiaceae bacterium]
NVSVTIYNSNFGLVRETRQVALGTGRVALSYADVSAHIQPESVHIRSLTDASALQVFEQNYRYDLLTPQKLLEKYVGRKLRVARYNEKLGTDEIKEAELLSVEGGPVLRIDGEVVTNFNGRFAFPSLPENLVAKPTLEWLLGSTQPRQSVEVTYLTSNMSWRADYVVSLDAADAHADLNGWVTLENTSGATFMGAELKLVAGDVQRVAPPPPPMAEMAAMDAPVMAPAPPSFRQEGLFEYHLYTLQRPTDLLDKEQKQVSLLEAHGISTKKRLLLRGQPHWYFGRYGAVLDKQKVSAYLVVENSEKNKLGMPLPKGTVRVYKADKTGAQQFVGEDAIDHTPRDEKLEIKLGEAFDVVADQKQTAFNVLGKCANETDWELTLRNHKDNAEVVDVEEPVSGDYSVVQSSHPSARKDANTFTFSIAVPARGEVKVTYRVRVRSC